MPVLLQIRDILAETKFLNLKRHDQSVHLSDMMKDISDGAAYTRI
jgi:hypothetical protein